jgi:hypothetical protein
MDEVIEVDGRVVALRQQRSSNSGRFGELADPVQWRLGFLARGSGSRQRLLPTQETGAIMPCRRSKTPGGGPPLKLLKRKFVFPGTLLL